MSNKASALVDPRDAPGIPWFVRLDGNVYVGLLRRALRYHAVAERGRSRSIASLVRCWFVVGGQNALMGFCASGTLRRHHDLWTSFGFPTSAGQSTQNALR